MFYPGLLRYVSLRVGEAAAQDLVQSVFTSACRHWDSYDETRGSVGIWLYCIAQNRLKNFYRDHRAQQSLDGQDCGEPLTADYMAEQALLLVEKRDALAKALEQLPERSRRVVVLRYFADLSNQEIARLLHLSHDNVRTILSRSLRQLAQLLKENGYP